MDWNIKQRYLLLSVIFWDWFLLPKPALNLHSVIINNFIMGCHQRSLKCSIWTLLFMQLKLWHFDFVANLPYSVVILIGNLNALLVLCMQEHPCMQHQQQILICSLVAVVDCFELCLAKKSSRNETVALACFHSSKRILWTNIHSSKTLLYFMLVMLYIIVPIVLFTWATLWGSS